MGQGNTKPSVADKHNEFATIYISEVLAKDVSNIPIITKWFHLFLFLIKNGENYIYNNEYKRVSVKYSEVCRDYRAIHSDYANCNRLINNYIPDFTNHKSYSGNINIDVDCTDLNKIIKIHAQNELQKQRNKLTKFTLKNIECWKQEITVGNENIAKNNLLLQRGNLQKHEIDSIIATNTETYNKVCEYEKLIKESDTDKNKTYTIENNIEKLEKLIKILYCNEQRNPSTGEPESVWNNRLKQQQSNECSQLPIEGSLHLPQEPTNYPIVYPTAPNEVASLTPTTNATLLNTIPIATVVIPT